MPKIHRDIEQKVSSAVYDTLRNGDSVVYHTPRNGDSVVYLGGVPGILHRELVLQQLLDWSSLPKAFVAVSTCLQQARLTVHILQLVV